MKNIKDVKKFVVYVCVIQILSLQYDLFSMAKRYPLPQQTESQQVQQNVIKVDNVRKENISEKELKHGINLQTLPVKNNYKVGFINSKNGLIGTVERYVPAAEQLPSSAKERVIYAINELLKGPSEEEKLKGYISLIPEGTKLVDCEIIVDDFGVRVKLEFSEEILQNIDEVKNILIQDQITYTIISLDIPKIYGFDVFVKGKPLGYYASGGR